MRRSALAKALVAAPPETASFHAWVAEQQRDAGPRRKGERTRDRIRLATVALLNEVGYRHLKVADICDRAGVTAPVLYRYFDGKQALTMDVLGEFLDRFMAAPRYGGTLTPNQTIFAANRRWVTMARANAGLMRCLLEASEDEPAFKALFARESDRWNRRIVDSIVRRFPSAEGERADIELTIVALGGMVDELTRRLFAARAADVTRLVEEVASDDDALAHFISVLWYRALYGAEPPAGEGPGVASTLVRAAAGRPSPAPRKGGRK